MEVDDIFKKIVKMFLLVFHGNAAVERAFSTNKNCLDDNLLEKSLVSRRIVTLNSNFEGPKLYKNEFSHITFELFVVDTSFLHETICFRV